MVLLPACLSVHLPCVFDIKPTVGGGGAGDGLARFPGFQ